MHPAVQRALRATCALGVLGLLAATLPLLAGACRPSRFSTCRNNAECQVDGGPSPTPVCFNLKCVACRYDSDCEVGRICNANLNTCEPVSGMASTTTTAPQVNADDVNQGGPAWQPPPEDAGVDAGKKKAPAKKR